MKENKPAIATLILFLVWGTLRFFLMPMLRQSLGSQFHLAGNDQIIFNHLLIVIECLLLFCIYLFFLKRSMIQQIQVQKPPQSEILIGLRYGLFIFLMSIPVAYYFGMKLSPQFSVAGTIGNLMSNPSEEVIYRGILFSAALSLFGRNWVSITASAVAFGVGHWDLPAIFQAYIAIVGAVLSLSYLKTRNLAVPFIAHMIADVLLDSFFH